MGARHVGLGVAVPRICHFYGITIAMYYAEHGRPHIHALYAEYECSMDIASGEILAGGLPARALRLVVEWVGLHRPELFANWERAGRGEALVPVNPLE